MDIERFLQHADWLERLAPALVSEPGQAEDAMQETWLALAKNPPRDAGEPRGWLRTVLKNAARRSARTTRRQRHHETRKEADRASFQVPTAEEVLDRTIIQQRVTAAVLQLPADLREVVLLRYFEGCTSAAISRQLGCPAGTIRNRLFRAREQLRRELDQEFGDRTSWGIALAALGHGKAGLGEAGLGEEGLGEEGLSAAKPNEANHASTIASAKPKLRGLTPPILAGIALIMIVVGSFAILRIPNRPDPPHLQLAGTHEPENSSHTDRQAQRGVSSSDQHGKDGADAVQPRPEEDPTVAPSKIGPPSESRESQPHVEEDIKGRLINATGHPLSEVTLGWFPSGAIHRAFQDQRIGRRFTRDELFVALESTQPNLDRSRLAALTPLEREQLWVGSLPPGYTKIEHFYPVITQTSATGEFRLTPSGPSGKIFMIHEGWFVLSREVDLESSAWTIRVTRELQLTGSVIDADGFPVGGARVEIGGPPTPPQSEVTDLGKGEIRRILLTTDASGRFATRVPHLADSRDGHYGTGHYGIAVSADHYEPCVLSAQPSLSTGITVITLHRIATPEKTATRAHHVTLEGQVFGSDRAHASDVRVYVGESSTTSGIDGRYRIRVSRHDFGKRILALKPGAAAAVGPRVAELRAARSRGSVTPHHEDREAFVLDLFLVNPVTIKGHVVPVEPDHDITDYRVSLADATEFSDGWIEEHVADQRLPVTVQSDGSFQIPGLFPRRYRLKLWHRTKGLITTTAPITLGHEPAIRVQRAQLWSRLKGRLLKPNGSPLSGVEVSLRWTIYRYGENRDARSIVVAHTDSAGAFTLHDIPMSDSELVFRDPAIATLAWPTSIYDGSEVVLDAPVLRQFQFCAQDPIAFDKLKVLDASDQSIRFWISTTLERRRGRQASIIQGRSPVCDVPPSAHTLSLEKNGIEIRRVPLHLKWDEVTIVAP